MADWIIPPMPPLEDGEAASFARVRMTCGQCGSSIVCEVDQQGRTSRMSHDCGDGSWDIIGD